MRILVTGREGQLVSALLAKAGPDLEVVALGRPQLDLANPGDVTAQIAAIGPDLVVNAAAFTAVDLAESEEAIALAINGAGAGAVAKAAAALALPVIQISTDYVFEGSKTTPYLERDPIAPISAYGRSKLAGERAVMAATPDHAILRTSWVYAVRGKNFLRTMLRLASTRPEVSVVADQHGAPGFAPDLADAIIAIARNLLREPQNKAFRGIFHMSGGGETTWAGFAEEIFRLSALRGGPSALVNPIATWQYPTPARRPANSRLDCSKLAGVHGVMLPHWQEALARCMDEVQASGELQS